MNYSDLKLISCIDVLNFEIFAADGSKIYGKHVTDYQTHGQVNQSLLAEHGTTGEKMAISLLEVSLDVQGDREAAIRLISDLVVNCTLPEDLSIRAYVPFATTGHAKKIGDTYDIHKADQVLAVLLKGGSIYIGNQRNWACRKVSPVSVRAYWKATDSGKDLPPEEHRARFEVTIQGEGFSQVKLDTLTSWPAWTQWRVTNCAKLFGQRLPGKNRTTPRNGAALDQQGVKAADYRKASRENGTDKRRKKHKTPANSALNEKIRGTLAALQYRLNKPTLGKNSEKNSTKTSTPARPLKAKPSKANRAISCTRKNSRKVGSLTTCRGETTHTPERQHRQHRHQSQTQEGNTQTTRARHRKETHATGRETDLPRGTPP